MSHVYTFMMLRDKSLDELLVKMLPLPALVLGNCSSAVGLLPHLIMHIQKILASLSSVLTT